MEQIMQSIFYFLNENLFGANWFVGWTSMISIIGVLYTLIKYLIYKKIGRPYYQMRTRRLISPKSKEMEGLEIRYNNTKITQLSSTELFVWNGGNEIIKSSDVPTMKPFQITVDENIQIFSAEIIKTNKTVNNIQLTQVNEHEVLITFEFLGKNQGASILLVHTGDSSADIHVSGETMQGARLESRVKYSKSTTTMSISKLVRMMPYFIMIYGVIMILLSLLYDYLSSIESDSFFSIPLSAGFRRIFLLILGIIFLIFGITETRHSIPRSLETR